MSNNIFPSGFPAYCENSARDDIGTLTDYDNIFKTDVLDHIRSTFGKIQV